MEALFKSFLQSPKYKLKLIDTIDYFILSLDEFNISEKNLNPALEYVNFSSPKPPCDIIKKVADIYKNMEILVEIIETPYVISKNEFDNIKDICGKNIPIKDQVDNKFLYEKMLVDFSKILEFSRLKKYWSDLKLETSSFSSLAQDTIEDLKKEHKKEQSEEMSDLKPVSSRKGINKPIIYSNLLDKTDGNPVPFTGSELYCDADISINNLENNFLNIGQCNYNYIDDKEILTNNFTYILYNSLFNISIILNKEDQFVIDIILKDFPEFIHIDRLNNLSIDKLDLLNKFFNNKIFISLDDLKDKVSSLKNLYDIGSKKNNIEYGKKYSEKEEILMIINKTYEQNNNINDKIRASDLYTLVENYFPLLKGNLTFRKRVSSYFIETGLSKKRLSDGIYYYGLKKKEYNIEKSYNTENKNKISNINIEDLMKQRELELDFS